MKGYFFNALSTEDLETYPTGYDRNYSAEDFDAFYKRFFSDGILIKNSADECLVTASGTTLSIKAGCAIVQGMGIDVEGNETVTATSGGHVVIRVNKLSAVREVQFLVVSTIVQTEDIWDLKVATVTVSGTTATVKDARTYAAFTGKVPGVTVWSETSASPTTRTVTISGVTSWDDVLNKTLFIKAGTYGTTSPATLNINGLGAKSLYFPEIASANLTTTPPVYYWVRAGGVYQVVWNGNYLVVQNMQVRQGSTTYLGLLQLYHGVAGASTELAATAGSVKIAYDKAVDAYNLANSVNAITSGSWTPSVTEANTYVTRTGTYVVCNNIVTVSFYLEYTTTLSALPAKEIAIGGLPYTAAANAAGGGAMDIPALPSGYSPNGFRISLGDNKIRPRWISSSGSSGVTTTGQGQRFVFSGSISYPI